MSIQPAGFRFIPKGGVKIADKNSDAIAYLYETAKGQPAAVVYYGKQTKPVLRCYFVGFPQYGTPEQQRAKRIAELFASRQASAKIKADRSAKRKATGRGVEVGQYMVASWGYDQTNVDFYRIEKLVGSTMVELIKVGAISTGESGNMSGKVIPNDQPLKGAEPIRVVVKGGSAKVNGNYASVWDGTPRYVSWYA